MPSFHHTLNQDPLLNYFLIFSISLWFLNWFYLNQEHLYIQFLHHTFKATSKEKHGEGNGNPLQYSCLENPMEGGAWWAAVHGVAKSQTRLSDFTFTFSLSCIGEGNGNPLQCSCLKNPKDGGAWWTSVYGVAQSRTRLKWLSSSKEKQKNLQLHKK